MSVDRSPTSFGPVRMHPVTGLDRLRRAGVDGVQQRGVRAVELDQRPRNGRSSGWPSSGSGCHVHDNHGSDGGNRNHLGQRLVGHRVVFSGRDERARPSDPRVPTRRRSRSAVKNWPRIGPTERV